MTNIPFNPDPAHDYYPEIQAALDAGDDVTLPPGDLSIFHPLVAREIPGVTIPSPIPCPSGFPFPGLTIKGSGEFKTRLWPYIGSGHALVIQPKRPFPATLGDSLVTGPGNAVRTPNLVVYTEPNLAKLANRPAFTASYFVKRVSPAPDYGSVHVHCGSSYGGVQRDPWAVGDYLGRFYVKWDGKTYFAPPTVGQDLGVVYCVALTFGGGRVRLLVGKPGEAFTLLIDQPVNTPGVPMYANGVDVLGIGMIPIGPFGQSRGLFAPDAWFDGFEFASAVRFQPGDPVPTAKPEVAPDTALILNGEVDDPFWLGRRPGNDNSGRAFILPQGSQETQQTGYCVSDLSFMAAGSASGPCLYDTTGSRVERVNFVQTYVGLALCGSTYACRIDQIDGNSEAFGFLQTGQSEFTLARGVYTSAGGISFVTAGSVGGTYQGVFLSPLGGSHSAIYCYGSNEVNIFGGQFDDEGQSGNVVACVIADAAEVKVHGMLVVRSTPGPLFVCNDGGSVHVWGSWLNTPGGEELVKFKDAPHTQATILGCRIENPNVPVTKSTQWCLFTGLRGIFTPGLSTVSTPP